LVSVDTKTVERWITRERVPHRPHRAAMAKLLGVDETYLWPSIADDQRTVQHWRLWLDFWSLSAHDPTHARWQESAYELWRTDVRKVLERGVASREFRVAELDVAMADFLVTFDGLAVQAYLPGSKIGPAQAREYLRGWVERRLMTADS